MATTKCPRAKRPARTEVQVVADEAAERLALLVYGAEDATERAANVALLRRCLPEAESLVVGATPAGRRRAARELAVLQLVLERAERLV